MVTYLRNAARPRVPRWHAGFLALLPAIAAHARIAFRHRDPEALEDAVAECIAGALVAYVRLYEQGKVELAYPSVLARFAAAQVRSGRKVGSRLSSRDVMSLHCRQRSGIVVEPLDYFDRQKNQWREAVVQDTRTAPVPEIVCFRLDFADWLRRLPVRNRRIAESLALGNSTSETAEKFDVSPGRIAQLRRELAESWAEFRGENSTATKLEPVAA